MKCAPDFCDREASLRAKNSRLMVCSGHYQQDAKGKALVPLKPREKAVMDESGRVCTACDRYKPWDEFYKRKNKPYRQSQCRACMIAANRVSNKRRAQASDND